MATTEVLYKYRDNFDIKDQTANRLVPEYFDDIDVNLRTVGMVGFTTEQIGNISEDTFNTGSILYQEMFVPRAVIPESIYSHAAIFQLTDVFSTASVCDFLLVLDEEAVIRNALADVDNYDRARGVHRFFIDKDTTIYVEGIPFTLDYNIEIDIVLRRSDNAEDEYVFSAQYIKDYKNSISDIDNNYVKIVRSGDGYFALQVQCHQMVREVHDEQLISSNLINYPVVTVEFEGKLAGFDVMYAPPTGNGSSEWVQLDTKVVFSQPSTKPFCYFQMVDTDKLQITFNSKDNYWMPEFNSDLEITLYLTEGGATGTTFDVYTGNNIELVPSTERWPYANTYLTAAKPIGAAKNGQDQLSLDALKSLAAEGYRTATALTTENDLDEFFGNYKYRYGDATIRFLKKRDDVYERVYSAYLLMKNSNYIYHTSTLRLALNVSDFEEVETDTWMLDPGYLFTANDSSGYAQFYRDPDLTEMYREMYDVAVENDEVPYIIDPVPGSVIPEYLDRAASFAEYKRRLDVDDKRTVFDLTLEELEELDDPINKKFLLINPFLIRFRKNPNLVTCYLTCLHNESLLEFYKQNNIGGSSASVSDGSFVQFIANTFYIRREFERAKRYIMQVNVSPTISVSDEYPIVQATYDESGNINGYIVNEKYSVKDNDLRVFVEILDTDGNPICVTELYPTDYVLESTTITFGGEIYTDDHITSDSKFRILDGRIYRDEYEGNYYQVHANDATLYDYFDANGSVLENDISSNVVMAIYNDGDVYKNETNGYYYKKDDVDEGFYLLCYADGNPFYMYVVSTDNSYYLKHLDDEDLLDHYNASGEMIERNVPRSSIQHLIDEGVCTATQEKDSLAFVEAREDFYHRLYKIFDNVINMSTRDDILIPMNDVVVKVIVLYNRVYDQETGKLRPATSEETNNPLNPYSFHMAGQTLDTYIWTNEYITNREPVTLMRVLDSVRIYLTFEDYTEYVEDYDPETGLPIGGHYTHDIMDIQLYSLPFIRWSIVTDDDKLNYFMSSFYSQYIFLVNTAENRLRNLSAVDVKFFKTYGCSSNYIIGEDNEPLDVLNIQLEFDMWFVNGTDTLEVIPEVKRFIKEQVETLSDNSYDTIITNNLYISNLMRKIENQFDYVDHIRFIRINNYEYEYQAVKGIADSLSQLSVEERRWYVPEMLVVDLDDIIINEYLTS